MNWTKRWVIATNVVEARRLGETTYFTGKPCKYGHIAERVTSSRVCKECAAKLSRECRERNIKEWLIREEIKRNKNRDRINNYQRDRYKTDKPKIRAATDKWRIANKDRDAAKTAKRKAMRLNACPPWVDLKEIEVYYAKARELTRLTGIEHEVDHIHPLQGKNLCGLHVPWNLQVITKSENCRKKNHMIDAALQEG